MHLTLTPDVVLLCRAIDAGDDSALSILADALEEAGDARAAGLRWEIRHAPRHLGRATAHAPLLVRRGKVIRWGWVCLVPPRGEPAGVEVCRATPHPSTYRRLIPRTRSGAKTYPTRSEAYLALAAALTIPETHADATR